MGGESIGEKRIKGESVDLVCSCYSGSIHGLYCGCRCDSLCPSGVFNLAIAATTQAGGTSQCSLQVRGGNRRVNAMDVRRECP